MRIRNPLLLTRSTLLGSALFLGACMTSTDETDIDPAFRNAKVDETTVGQSLTTNLALAGDWNAVATPSAGLQGLADISAKAGTLNGHGTALAKISARDTGVVVDTSTISLGYVIVTRKTPGLLITSFDSAWVKWDAQAKDSIKDNENILYFRRVETHHLGGKVEIVEFTDADGNKLINAVPGMDNKVKLVFTSEANGVTESTTLVVSSGPDASFDAEADNRILKAEWSKRKGAKLMAQGAYLDADNDGIVVDNAKTSLVLAKFSELEPQGRPLVKQVDAEAKVRIFTNKGGDEPVSFSFQEEWFTGRINSVTLKNRLGGTDIIKGDTLTVQLETKVTSQSDTLKFLHVDFVMNPGQDLKTDADDSLYAIHIRSQKRFGLERSAEFHLISDKPVPHGKLPESGSFSGKATYANGQSASLKGTFTPTSFMAEYTGPNGRTVKVEYTR